MTAYQTDVKLIASCLAGERAAWNDLVARYSALVYSVPKLRRYELSHQDSQEVFQNTWLQVYRNLSQLRDPTRFVPWLIQIAHRETLLFIRRSKPWCLPLSEDIATLNGDGQRLEMEDMLRQAVSRLEEKERAVIVAILEDDGATFDTIAERAHLPRGSVYYYRQRAIEHLLQYLLADGKPSI